MASPELKEKIERIHGVIEALQKNLECPICLEVSKNPVSTKCGHKFCNLCLLKTLNNRRSVPCPLCKKPVTPRSLQPLSEWSRLISAVDTLHQAYLKDTALHMAGDHATPSTSAAAPPSHLAPKSSALRGKGDGIVGRQGSRAVCRGALGLQEARSGAVEEEDGLDAGREAEMLDAEIVLPTTSEDEDQVIPPTSCQPTTAVATTQSHGCRKRRKNTRYSEKKSLPEQPVEKLAEVRKKSTHKNLPGGFVEGSSDGDKNEIKLKKGNLNGVHPHKKNTRLSKTLEYTEDASLDSVLVEGKHCPVSLKTRLRGLPVLGVVEGQSADVVSFLSEDPLTSSNPPQRPALNQPQGNNAASSVATTSPELHTVSDKVNERTKRCDENSNRNAFSSHPHRDISDDVIDIGDGNLSLASSETQLRNPNRVSGNIFGRTYTRNKNRQQFSKSHRAIKKAGSAEEAVFDFEDEPVTVVSTTEYKYSSEKHDTRRSCSSIISNNVEASDISAAPCDTNLDCEINNRSSFNPGPTAKAEKSKKKSNQHNAFGRSKCGQKFEVTKIATQRAKSRRRSSYVFDFDDSPVNSEAPPLLPADVAQDNKEVIGGPEGSKLHLVLQNENVVIDELRDNPIVEQNENAGMDDLCDNPIVEQNENVGKDKVCDRNDVYESMDIGSMDNGGTLVLSQLIQLCQNSQSDALMNMGVDIVISVPVDDDATAMHFVSKIAETSSPTTINQTESPSTIPETDHQLAFMVDSTTATDVKLKNDDDMNITNFQFNTENINAYSSEKCPMINQSNELLNTIDIPSNEFEAPLPPTLPKPKQIFKTRGQRVPAPQLPLVGSPSSTDPYTFISTTPQRTRKTRKRAAKKRKKVGKPSASSVDLSHDTDQSVDLIIPETERGVVGSCGVESDAATAGSEKPDELSSAYDSLNQMISEAEDYDLVFSQQIRDMLEEATAEIVYMEQERRLASPETRKKFAMARGKVCNRGQLTGKYDSVAKSVKRIVQQNVENGNKSRGSDNAEQNKGTESNVRVVRDPTEACKNDVVNVRVEDEVLGDGGSDTRCLDETQFTCSEDNPNAVESEHSNATHGHQEDCEVLSGPVVGWKPGYGSQENEVAGKKLQEHFGKGRLKPVPKKSVGLTATEKLGNISSMQDAKVSTLSRAQLPKQAEQPPAIQWQEQKTMASDLLLTPRLEPLTVIQATSKMSHRRVALARTVMCVEYSDSSSSHEVEILEDTTDTDSQNEILVEQPEGEKTSTLKFVASPTHLGKECEVIENAKGEISSENEQELPKQQNHGVNDEDIVRQQSMYHLETENHNSQPLSVATVPETRDAFKHTNSACDPTVEAVDEQERTHVVTEVQNSPSISSNNAKVSSDYDVTPGKTSKILSSSEDRIIVSVPRIIAVRRYPRLEAAGKLRGTQQPGSVDEGKHDDCPRPEIDQLELKSGRRITREFATGSCSEESSCTGIVEPTPREAIQNKPQLGDYSKPAVIPILLSNKTMDVVPKGDGVGSCEGSDRSDENEEADPDEMTVYETVADWDRVSSINEGAYDGGLEQEMKHTVGDEAVVTLRDSPEIKATRVTGPTPAISDEDGKYKATKCSSSQDSHGMIGPTPTVLADSDESVEPLSSQLNRRRRKAEVTLSKTVDGDIVQPSLRIRTRSVGVVGVVKRAESITKVGVNSSKQRSMDQHESPGDDDKPVPRYRTRSAGALGRDANHSRRKSLSLRKRKSSGDSNNEQSPQQVNRNYSTTSSQSYGMNDAENAVQEKSVIEIKKSKLSRNHEDQHAILVVSEDSLNSEDRTFVSDIENVCPNAIENRSDEDLGWQTQLSDEDSRQDQLQCEAHCPLAECDKQSLDLIVSSCSSSQSGNSGGTEQVTAIRSQVGSGATHVSESQADDVIKISGESSYPCSHADGGEICDHVKQSPSAAEICPVQGQLVWNAGAEGFVVEGLLSDVARGGQDQPTIVSIQEVGTGAVVLDAVDSVQVVAVHDQDLGRPGSTDSSTQIEIIVVPVESAGTKYVSNKDSDSCSSVEELDVTILSRRRKSRRCGSVEVLELHVSEENDVSSDGYDRCSSVESVTEELAVRRVEKKTKKSLDDFDDQEECSIICEKIATSDGEVSLICETTASEMALKKCSEETVKENGSRLRSRHEKLLNETPNCHSVHSTNFSSSNTKIIEKENNTVGKRRRSTRPVQRICKDSFSKSKSVGVETGNQLPPQKLPVPALFVSEDTPCDVMLASPGYITVKDTDDEDSRPSVHSEKHPESGTFSCVDSPRALCDAQVSSAGDHTVMDTDDEDSPHSVPSSIGDIQVIPPTPPTKPNKSLSVTNNAKPCMTHHASMSASQHDQLVVTVVANSTSSQLQVSEQDEYVALLEEPEVLVSPLPFTPEAGAGSPLPISPAAEDMRMEDEEEDLCPGSSTLDELPDDGIVLDKTDGQNGTVDPELLQQTGNKLDEDGGYPVNIEDSSEPIPSSIDPNKETKPATATRRSSRRAQRASKKPSKKQAATRSLRSADDIVPPAPTSDEDLPASRTRKDVHRESKVTRPANSDGVESGPGKSQDCVTVSSPVRSLDLDAETGTVRSHDDSPMEAEVTMIESHPKSAPESPSKLNQTYSSGLSSESEPLNTQHQALLRQDLDQLKDEIAQLEAQLMANNTTLPELSGLGSQLDASQPQLGGTQDALEKYGNTIAASERVLSAGDSLDLPLDLSDDDKPVKPKGKRKSFQFKSNGLIDDSDEDSEEEEEKVEEESDDDVIPSSLNNSTPTRRLRSSKGMSSPSVPRDAGDKNSLGDAQPTIEGSMQSTMESMEPSVSLLLPKLDVEDDPDSSAPNTPVKTGNALAQAIDLSSPLTPTPPTQLSGSSTSSHPRGRPGRKRTAASQKPSKKNTRNKNTDMSQDDEEKMDRNVSVVGPAINNNQPASSGANLRKRKLSKMNPGDGNSQAKKAPKAGTKQTQMAGFLLAKSLPSLQTSPRTKVCSDSSVSPAASRAPSTRPSTVSESPNLNSFGCKSTRNNPMPDSVLLVAEISPALQRKPAVVELLSPGGRGVISTGLRKLHRRSQSSVLDTPTSCSTATADSNSYTSVKQERTSPTTNTAGVPPDPKVSPHTPILPAVKQEHPSPAVSTSTADSSSTAHTASSSEASPAVAANFPQKPRWVFVTSGIKSVKVKTHIEQFAQLVGARISGRFTQDATHLILQPAVTPGDPLLCSRTLKYFQAIAHHRWLLNYRWVLDSLKKGQILPEEDYEMQGDSVKGRHEAPQRSRLATKPLLGHFEICCPGKLQDLSRDELHSLIEACGAGVVHDPSMFSFDPGRRQILLVEDDENKDTTMLKRVHQMYEVPVVDKDWLLDSIGCWGAQRLAEYAVVLN